MKKKERGKTEKREIERSKIKIFFKSLKVCYCVCLLTFMIVL